MPGPITLNEKDAGLWAFVQVHGEGQLDRIRNDPNFRQLSDDAKLALGGLERGFELMREMFERARDKKKPKKKAK